MTNVRCGKQIMAFRCCASEQADPADSALTTTIEISEPDRNSMPRVQSEPGEAVNAEVDCHEPLVEKYRPRQLRDLIGLVTPKRTLGKFILRPFKSAWMFIGPSGVGKTTAAHLVAEEIGAQLHLIAAKWCDLEAVKRLCEACAYVPNRDWKPVSFHLSIVDEADQMSHAAQIAFLSVLDGTVNLPNTIIVFTANSVQRLEPRFRSRCHILEFTTDGIAEGLEDRLRWIWAKESRDHVCAPDFAKLVAASECNERSALDRPDVEILSALGPG